MPSADESVILGCKTLNDLKAEISLCEQCIKFYDGCVVNVLDTSAADREDADKGVLQYVVGDDEERMDTHETSGMDGEASEKEAEELRQIDDSPSEHDGELDQNAEDEDTHVEDEEGPPEVQMRIQMT